MSHYKNPKNSDTRKIYVNHPKIWTVRLYRKLMCSKDADGMANIVDPDQSDLGLHSLPRSDGLKT